MDEASSAPTDLSPLSSDEAWLLLLALRGRTDAGGMPPQGALWGFRLVGGHWVAAHDRDAELWLDPVEGVLRGSRRALVPDARSLLDLHLHHATRARADGQVIAVLGQSLDGFIATRSGDSRHLNGRESLTHLHRVRALSDAILIGVGTALADGPRLTTRNVAGPHAVRVVVDPRGRLPTNCGLLCDGAAATLVIRASTGPTFETRISDQATALHLPGSDGAMAPRSILAALAERGIGRVLVEGGGVTVGRFLEAGLIDRLQLAVTPLIIGGGRPALPLAAVDRLDQAMRPACRRYLLGDDVLFDLHLRARGDPR